MGTLLLTLTVFFAAEPDQTFTKFDYRDFDRGSLSTATVSFRRGETEVDLVGVVHIADDAYYQEIQRDLDSYDLVFYEMVTDGAPEDISALSALQRAAGDLLKLTFQIGHIAYGSPHFVHADLSWTEIEQVLEGDPLPPPPKDRILERFVPQLRREAHETEDYFADNPVLRRSIKVFLGQLLGDIPAVLAQLNVDRQGEGEDVLISARNRRAMDVLRPHLAGRKRFALLYGAAHMPDFARRLRSLGFEPFEVCWHVAWRIGDEPERRSF